jgi:thiamine-phosphate pyrophosphorylase
MLLLAGANAGARAWQANGFHNRTSPFGLRSASVHNLREIRAAERQGAHLIFLSPVFPTRSHPNARPLTPLRFAMLSRQTRLPVIALGGMDADKAKRLGPSAFYGWAAIDAWGSG